MHVLSLLDIIKDVLLNKYVIFAAVAVLLYVNFVYYVANYRRRPKRHKKIKVAAQPKPAAPAPAKSSDEETEGGEEE